MWPSNPDLYKQIEERGHTVGNHTHNHLNGWKTSKAAYIENIYEAKELINTNIFRPPYGRIKRSQSGILWHKDPQWKIYMWDVLSIDFDKKLTGQQCLRNVLDNISPGSIVVFHDSEKAWPRMSYALPKVLEYCRQQKWLIKGLPKY